MAKSSNTFICAHQLIFMWWWGHGLYEDLTLKIQTIRRAFGFFRHQLLKIGNLEEKNEKDS